jgi:hypothetical protein
VVEPVEADESFFVPVPGPFIPLVALPSWGTSGSPGSIIQSPLGSSLFTLSTLSALIPLCILSNTERFSFSVDIVEILLVSLYGVRE